MTRRAIITGASSGIGREIVRKLAADHWRVIAVARRDRQLAELASQWPDAVIPAPVDITSQDAPARIIQTAQDRFAGLDLLVNNAGTSWVGSMRRMPVRELDRVLNTNVRALMLMCCKAIPILEKSHCGQIINIASVAAHLPMEQLAVYCASKSAVVMYSNVLAKELQECGIRVNVLSPTGTDTEIFKKCGVEVDQSMLVPAEQMAQLVMTLINLPAQIDVGEFVTRKRFKA